VWTLSLALLVMTQLLHPLQLLQLALLKQLSTLVTPSTVALVPTPTT
jgi:hypothetical protein